MFLEQNSTYSPTQIGATYIHDLRENVSNMIQELEYIIWMTNDANLRDSRNLIAIFGDDTDYSVIDSRRILWDNCRDRLINAAYTLLGAKEEDLEKQKHNFVAVLRGFCKETNEMNKEFSSKALNALESAVSARIACSVAVRSSGRRRRAQKIA